MNATARRAGAVSALSAAVVGVAAVAAGTALSPSFSWTATSLSRAGARGEPSAAVFNGGLAAAALLAVPLVAVAVRTAGRGLERTGAGLFGVSVAALGAVAALPLPTPGHVPAGLAFFSAFTAGLVAHGAGAVRSGRRAGYLTAGTGAVHALAWAVWAVVLAPTVAPGLALPEAVGVALFAAWASWAGLGLLGVLDGPLPVSGDAGPGDADGADAGGADAGNDGARR